MKQRKNNMKEKKLYDWCLEQAVARFMGSLTDEHFIKLQSLDFPWEYYESELDKLGFNWSRNNPDGVRYKDLKKAI